MGMKSKRKGANAEREFADKVGGKRVPLSGAAAFNGEEFGNDVKMPNGWKAEVKRRAEMEKTLYGWLLDDREKPDVVAFRGDHMPWVVAMTLDQYLKLQNIQIAAEKLLECSAVEGLTALYSGLDDLGVAVNDGKSRTAST